MTNTTRRRAELAALLCFAAAPAAALELSLPSGAERTVTTSSDAATYRLPVGPWKEDGGVPVHRIDGPVARSAWAIRGRDLSTLQIMAPLRDQIEKAGYDVVFDCETGGCGGFDFRFGIEVLPAPDMYVNLSDYRFLAAEGPAGDAVLGLLVSRNGSGGYVQLIRAGTEGAPAATAPDDPPGPAAVDAPAPSSSDVIGRLEADGHVVLDDMRFASGSSSLGEGPVASLDAIADYLDAHDDRRILFVGHTDATGSLQANRALSRSRADAAAGYLRDRHGLGGGRVSAEGAGYLSPVASNLTQDGRQRNRRVEAVLLPAE